MLLLLKTLFLIALKFVKMFLIVNFIIILFKNYINFRKNIYKSLQYKIQMVIDDCQSHNYSSFSLC
jgi:hypothetical protein